MQRITYLNIIQTKVAAPTKIRSFELFFQLIRCKVLFRMRHCYSKYSIIIDQFLRFNDLSSKLWWSLAFIWYDSTVYTFYMVNHGAIMATFSDDSNKPQNLTRLIYTETIHFLKKTPLAVEQKQYELKQYFNKPIQLQLFNSRRIQQIKRTFYQIWNKAERGVRQIS